MADLTPTNEFEIEKEEFKAFSTTLAEIEWLLMALVIFYISVPGSFVANKSVVLVSLSIYCLVILFFHYVGLHKTHNRLKIVTETWFMIAFITLVLWNTGKLESPIFGLYILAIIVTATTLETNITFLEVGLITACGLFLGFTPSALAKISVPDVIRFLLILFPFWLVAYLTTMLAQEIKHSKKKIEYLSQTDGLTELWNLRMFTLLADMELKRSTRHSYPFSIVMFDADNLKQINDTYGHNTGNNYIKLLGKTIKESVRGTDVTARYGGDEFIVLMSETECNDALKASERVKKIIESKELDVSGKKIKSTVSIGIAGYPKDGTDLQELMNKADKAMYASKGAGKNRVTIFEEERNP
jgi:diguanylate cyclase (GGDEF)-like protein